MTRTVPLGWIVHTASARAGDFVYPVDASCYLSPRVSDADAMLLADAIEDAERAARGRPRVVALEYPRTLRVYSHRGQP